MFLIIEEAKKSILDFSQGTLKVLWMPSYDLAIACYKILFGFNVISMYDNSI